MIVNVYTKLRQSQYGAVSTAPFGAIFGGPVDVCTLEEICGKIDSVLGALASIAGVISILEKKQAGMGANLRLLIAATERLEKGRL